MRLLITPDWVPIVHTFGTNKCGEIIATPGPKVKSCQSRPGSERIKSRLLRNRHIPSYGSFNTTKVTIYVQDAVYHNAEKAPSRSHLARLPLRPGFSMPAP